MAGFATSVSGLSGNIISREYDPIFKYQPNRNFQPHEDDGAISTQSHKSTKVWKQQKIFHYNVNPQEQSRERVFESVVSGKDGRKQIVETTKWPYSVFAKLTMKFKGEDYGGTGTLVGPHHVLTCGHNIYDIEKNIWAEEITVYPALNGDNAPFGSAKVVKAFAFTQYTDNNDECYDIALLILNKSIGKYTGWAGMLSAPDDQLIQEKVNIVGYPGDKGRSQMWGMKDTIHHIKPEQFKYLIDTNRGQSGSAIWINKFGATMILGVHTLGGKYANTGVRLSREKFGILQQKIAESYEMKKPLQTKSSLPQIAFGRAKWAQYFGDVGIEPPLPPNINEILNGPCPIWPDKKMHETHLLTLIPQSVNGKPLTLKALGELVQESHSGKTTKYRFFYLGQFIDQPTQVTHWTFLTRNMIPDSQYKTLDVHRRLIGQYRGYEVPNILDTAVAFFMEYIQNKNRLYSDSDCSYTTCQEKHHSSVPLVIGFVDEEGLDIYDYNMDYAPDYEYRGVGAQKRL
jgi:V8-like Glu-specific endopeptidase